MSTRVSTAHTVEPNRRVQLTVATSLALIVAAVVPAVAATPRNATLTVKGGTIFKPNRFIGDGQRFSPDVTVMKSRGTLTIRNRTREPHTFSLIARSEVPRTARQVENCRACGPIGQSHGIPPNGEGPPTIPLVDRGARGFNQRGDSITFGPRQRVRIRVTARPNRTLRFLCAIHPWMIGKVAVRR